MDEKYAIVTGVASGIGKKIADSLYSVGVKVFGLDIETVIAPYHTFICDVSDDIQVTQVMLEISKETKSIDFLVNVAGMLTIGVPLGIKDISIKQWDAIMRVNLRSVLIMIKATYPFLKESNSASIVNISSEQSLYPEKYFSPYAVSKSGINTLTVCAAKEFLEEKIRVNAIALGTVYTNILDTLSNSKINKDNLFRKKNDSIPFGVMETDNVFQLVNFLLSDNSKFITGEIIRCDGGAYLSK